MSTWWWRLLAAFRPPDLVEAQRRIAELEDQADSLREALDAARAREAAAVAANELHGRLAQDLDARKERALRVLADTRRSERGRNQEAREVLEETGPEPAERGGDGG